MARRSKVLGLISVPRKHKTAYTIGIAGIGVLVAYFVGTKLIKPGGHAPWPHFPHFGGGGHPAARPPMRHPGAHPMPPVAKAHLANVLPRRQGLPVGGRISGIGGGGYNSKWPSGRIGHGGGYGVAGGYYASV